MARLARSAEVIRNPDGTGTFRVDGSEFPWYISREVDVEVSLTPSSRSTSSPSSSWSTATWRSRGSTPRRTRRRGRLLDR